MSEAKATITRVVTDCQVAAVGSDETFALTTVPKGSRVLLAQVQCLTSAAGSTDSTWWVGDAGDPDGIIQSLDTEQTAAAWVGITTAAYMLTSGGKLYNADTVVNCYYTQGATDGATAPKLRVVLWIGTP